MKYCKVGYRTYTKHEILHGLCVRCGYAADDACEFDFIRSWHARMGQQAVTAEDLLKQVNRRCLPNVLKNRAPATTENVERLLKTLIGGKVVTGSNKVIVEVIEVGDGSYRAVETDNAYLTASR